MAEFASTIGLFASYLTNVIDHGTIPQPDRNKVLRDLAVEAMERLRQLDFIVDRIREIEGSDVETLSDRTTLELRTLTECFYYCAARVRKIARKELPGLSGFECIGVRDVRNKLLEHPETFLLSFGWRTPSGPVLKALRYPGEESVFPDGGLYKNVAEFKANLESKLQNALRAGA